jgi:hypothetical protein
MPMKTDPLWVCAAEANLTDPGNIDLGCFVSGSIAPSHCAGLSLVLQSVALPEVCIEGTSFKGKDPVDPDPTA